MNAMKSYHFIIIILFSLIISCARQLKVNFSVEGIYHDLVVYGKSKLGCKKEKIFVLTDKKLLAKKIFDVYGCGKVIRVKVSDCEGRGGYINNLDNSMLLKQNHVCQLRKIDSLKRLKVTYFWSGQKHNEDKTVSFTRTIKYQHYIQQLNHLLEQSKEKSKFKSVRKYNSDISFDDSYKLTNEKSVLKGYMVKPYDLVKIDKNGIIRIWYKDLLSYTRYVRKNAKRSFEPPKETMEKIATYPKGGTLLIQVLRKTADESMMNKFILVLKDGNKIIKRVYLNDKNPQKQNINLEDGKFDFFMNAEVVPVKDALKRKLKIYLIDVLNEKRYIFSINPKSGRVKKLKNAIEKQDIMLQKLGKSNKIQEKIY